MNITRDNIKLMVGPGWSNLIDEIYDRLEKFPDSYISQIKEKWGRLRIYVFGVDEATLDFIDDIEERSGMVCEKCGKVGKLRTGGWLKTLCDECAK